MTLLPHSLQHFTHCSPSPLPLLTLIVVHGAHDPLQHDGEAVGEGQVGEQVLAHEKFQQDDTQGPHVHLMGGRGGGGAHTSASLGCIV